MRRTSRGLAHPIGLHRRPTVFPLAERQVRRRAGTVLILKGWQPSRSARGSQDAPWSVCSARRPSADSRRSRRESSNSDEEHEMMTIKTACASAMTAVLLCAGGAQAFDMGEMMNPTKMMNPSKWMGGNKDNDSDRARGPEPAADYAGPGQGYGAMPGYGSGYGPGPGYGGQQGYDPSYGPGPGYSGQQGYDPGYGPGPGYGGQQGYDPAYGAGYGGAPGGGYGSAPVLRWRPRLWRCSGLRRSTWLRRCSGLRRGARLRRCSGLRRGTWLRWCSRLRRGTRLWWCSGLWRNARLCTWLLRPRNGPGTGVRSGLRRPER